MCTAHHGGLEGWGVATRDGAHTYVAPQVKLAAVHQERPLQVLLHDPFLWPLPALPSNNLCHRSDRGGNLNALWRAGMMGASHDARMRTARASNACTYRASVGHVRRLDDPDVLHTLPLGRLHHAAHLSAAAAVARPSLLQRLVVPRELKETLVALSAAWQASEEGVRVR